jgi:hypothetical protein
VSRAIATCVINQDVLPGTYTAALSLKSEPGNPASVTQSLDFPMRVLSLVKTGKKRSIVSTIGPDPNGSTGSIIASDLGFRPRSIGTIRSVSRNFDMVAGFVNTNPGRRLFLYRTPRLPQTDLFEVSNLRLPGGTVAVLGGADIDGDGDDELMLLIRTKDGDSIDFRRVDYSLRRPVAGLTAAITGILPGEVISATGIQFDGDAEDEIALLTSDGTTATLSINDLLFVAPPTASTLAVLADEAGFGGGGEVVSMCVGDDGLDGVEEIFALVDTGGAQALRVFQPPASVGGMSVMVAEDPGFGNVPGKGSVSGIACTR